MAEQTLTEKVKTSEELFEVNNKDFSPEGWKEYKKGYLGYEDGSFAEYIMNRLSPQYVPKFDGKVKELREAGFVSWHYWEGEISSIRGRIKIRETRQSRTLRDLGVCDTELKIIYSEGAPEIELEIIRKIVEEAGLIKKS